jgi:hypothetical protein
LHQIKEIYEPWLSYGFNMDVILAHPAKVRLGSFGKKERPASLTKQIREALSIWFYLELELEGHELHSVILNY